MLLFEKSIVSVCVCVPIAFVIINIITRHIWGYMPRTLADI